MTKKTTKKVKLPQVRQFEILFTDGETKVRFTNNNDFKVIKIDDGTAFEYEQGLRDYIDKSDVYTKYAGICHNRDVDLETDCPKKIHFHYFIKCRYPIPLDKIARDFGIELQNINKIKVSWASALAYLTHKNDPNKAQYEDTEVKSNYDWAIDRDTLAVNLDRLVKKTIDGISLGSINHSNVISVLGKEHYIKISGSSHNAKLERALKVNHNLYPPKQKKLKCVYIAGDAKAGKSTLARIILKAIAKKNELDPDLSIYEANTSNRFDEYRFQPYIIYDELRAEDITAKGQSFSQFLELTDNYYNKRVSARYFNKDLSYAEYLVFTSVLNIDDFCNQLVKHYSDKGIKQPQIKLQIMRRFTEYYYVKSSPSLLSEVYYYKINTAQTPNEVLTNESMALIDVVAKPKIVNFSKHFVTPENIDEKDYSISLFKDDLIGSEDLV